MSAQAMSSEPRLARRALAGAIALALCAQIAILIEALRENPFAQSPINDARVYWEWAGEIASGRLVGSTPFLSAPLYPYFVAIVRVLGGGLAALYVVQILLHLATALVLYRIGESRFRPAVGVLAAVFWLLLADPAASTTRVLGSTLQAFVVVLLWERMLAVQNAPRPRTALALGLLLGLAVLTNPTLLLAVPLVALWLARIPAARAHGVRLALAATAAALLAIGPATLHNRLAADEWIPVSAQAGVTFRHGNAPGADGTYHAIEGISSDRLKQNVDARERAGAARGGGLASWNETNAHFFEEGLAWWRAEPGAALALVARKLAWFVAGRNYGDIYFVALERADGFADRLALAPLPAAWLVLPALVFALLLARNPVRFLPELVLLALPLATVLLFWYSPRYRFPALPVVAVLAAAALVEIVTSRRVGARTVVLAVAFALAAASGSSARRLGFDGVDVHRPRYEQTLGSVLVERGELERAAERFRRALELGVPEARASLGDVERRLGRTQSALELLRESVRREPRSAYARRSLAVALAGERRLDEALTEFEAALALDPNDWEALSGAGNVLLELGDAEGAVARYRAALAKNPSFASARSNLGHALSALGRTQEAEVEFRAALELDPSLVPAHGGLANVLAARGAFDAAISVLRRGLEHAPANASLASSLAWLLATSPDDGARDPKEALALAERLDRESGGADPGLLDTLAAALAANGRFDEAVKVVEQALARFRELEAPPDLEATVRARLELYRAREPYLQGPP